MKDLIFTGRDRYIPTLTHILTPLTTHILSHHPPHNPQKKKILMLIPIPTPYLNPNPNPNPTLFPTWTLDLINFVQSAYRSSLSHMHNDPSAVQRTVVYTSFPV